MINLVKKNIIKFRRIIPFLFKQINTGENKISNIWILLKKSLTIWVFPVFLISFLFDQYEIINIYIWCFSILYVILIILNYLKNNKFVFIMDRIVLMLLSFLIFINNKIITDKVFIVSAVLCSCIALVYIILFFCYKNKGKIFVLNFFKLSIIIEFTLGISVLLFGINSFITFNILLVLMVDILYKILILSIILNLKKRFSIQ